jgi:hypothetical protein
MSLILRRAKSQRHQCLKVMHGSNVLDIHVPANVVESSAINPNPGGMGEHGGEGRARGGHEPVIHLYSSVQHLG